MAPSPSFDVFLSYHSSAAAWVAKLKTALEAKQLKVWLDSDQILPGDIFAEALERGLQSSRAVALIVSSGSLQSNWVREEYYRALGLANATGHSLRLIPVVIESVSLPGFLSSRSWADFRDPAMFDQSLGRLYRGITGTHQPDAVPETTGPQPDSPNPAQGVDELNYLDRSLNREIQTVRQLQRVRCTAPIAGLAVFGFFATLNPNMETSTQAFAAVGAPLVTGLIGWGVTARQLSASQLSVTRLTCLKDGLELCRGRLLEAVGRVLACGAPQVWSGYCLSRYEHRRQSRAFEEPGSKGREAEPACGAGGLDLGCGGGRCHGLPDLRRLPAVGAGAKSG